MTLYVKRSIGFFVAAMVATTIAWSSPAAAASEEPSGLNSVAEAIAKDEEAFHATVEAVEPYLIEGADGTLTLDIPESVRSGVSTDAYEALLATVALTNAHVTGSESAVSARSAASASLSVAGTTLKAILKFISKNWKVIKDAAVKSGKWAWWKAGNCTRGAVNAIWAAYGQDAVLVIVEGPKAVLATAVVGCIKEL